MNENTGTLVVDLTILQALNLKMLVEDRIKTIDENAAKFPHLPMKDPYTYGSYTDLLVKLEAITPNA